MDILALVEFGTDEPETKRRKQEIKKCAWCKRTNEDWDQNLKHQNTFSTRRRAQNYNVTVAAAANIILLSRLSHNKSMQVTRTD